MSESFSARLRAATWSVHARAAGEGYLHRLVKGGFDRAEYGRLVAQHLAIYRALERAAALHDDDLAAGFHTAELDRLQRLEVDLATLQARSTTLPETDAYVARIRESASDPVLFLAHHYTRYLGDLSGGLFIGRALASHYGEHATTFYRFDIADVDAFKHAYRARLDGLGLSPADERRLIDEALVAYGHNSDVHAALEATAPVGVA